MINKAVLLDIDDTIYNVKKAKSMYKDDLSKELKINKNILNAEIDKIYLNLKNKVGYFSPEVFSIALAKKLKISNIKVFNDVLWDDDKFIKSIYKDSYEFLNKIYKSVEILIFSKGDRIFQNRKLKAVDKYLDKKNIYIYPDKVSHLEFLLNKLKHRYIFIIDDSPEVINKAKEINNKVITILVKRKFFNINYNYNTKVFANFKVKNLKAAAKIITSY